MTDLSDAPRELPDELLMAYADGELASADRARVERAIARNPALRETIAVFAATRDPVQRAFAPVLSRDVPDRLLAAIATAPIGGLVEPAVTKAATAGGLWSQLRDRWFAGLSPAMTFGLAMVVGAALGAGVHRQAINLLGTANGGIVVTADGRVEAQGVLAAALDRTASGTRFAAGGAQVTPLLTFKSLSGAVCRQYELGRADQSSFAGYACRTQGGRWQIEMHTQQATAASAGTSPGAFTPASGAAAVALEAAVSSMIDGDPIAADSEARLIAQGWRP